MIAPAEAVPVDPVLPEKCGIDATFVDVAYLDAVRAAIRPNTGSMSQDGIVDERHDASLGHTKFCVRMARAIEYELGTLAGNRWRTCLKARQGKYHELGS